MGQMVLEGKSEFGVMLQLLTLPPLPAPVGLLVHHHGA